MLVRDAPAAAMARMLYSLGSMVRETGQALDRLGCTLQGSFAYREQRAWRGSGTEGKEG